MIINRTELLKALNLLLPGLGMTDMDDKFIFVKNKVYSSNGFITISHPIKELDFCMQVKAKEFYSLIEKIKKDELDITANEKELKIKGGRCHAGFRIENEVPDSIKAIVEKDKQKKKWKILPNNFCEGVSFCLFSAAKESIKPEFNCLHIKKRTIESCDNFRLSQYKMNSLFDDDVLIPAESLTELYKYKPIKYFIDKGWIHFLNKEGVVYSCRKQEDTEYPDISKVIQNGEKTHIQLPKDLESTLDKMQIFSNDTNKQIPFVVTLKIEKNMLVLEGKNDAGWCKESLRIKDKTKNIQFNIQLQFLKDIIKQTREMYTVKKQIHFINENFIYCCTVSLND